MNSFSKIHNYKMKINFAVRWIFRNKITVNKILDIELNDNATIFSGPSSWYNPMDTIFSNKCDQEQSEGVSRKQILTVKVSKISLQFMTNAKLIKPTQLSNL